VIKNFLKLLLAPILIGAIALTVFWYARPADLSFDEFRAGVPNSAYSHFADIDGVRIHYQEKGTGAPLVLLHGFSSSTYSWKDVFEPLAKSYRVIAVDLKGFGFSTSANSRTVVADSRILEIAFACFCDKPILASTSYWSSTSRQGK
jgi:hypothetical protein